MAKLRDKKLREKAPSGWGRLPGRMACTLSRTILLMRTVVLTCVSGWSEGSRSSSS